MLKLIPVTKERFGIVYKKMEKAFPYEERRSVIEQEKCLTDSRFDFFEIYDESEDIGFVAIWNLPSFVFIEHIAIDSALRGCGYGSKAIDLIKSHYNKSIVLEAEEPITEQQIKRIAFYKKLGFYVNDFYYEQPSYHNGDGVPLKILSFPSLLTTEQFENFIKETHSSAYAQTKT